MTEISVWLSGQYNLETALREATAHSNDIAIAMLCCYFLV